KPPKPAGARTRISPAARHAEPTHGCRVNYRNRGGYSALRTRVHRRFDLAQSASVPTGVRQAPQRGFRLTRSELSQVSGGDSPGTASPTRTSRYKMRQT